MKQSCGGNMIWSPVKQRKATVKLQIFLKMKKVFTILALKEPNSEERIFTVYKYSRRLLTRTLSPKVLSNNRSLWLFLWLAQIFPSQILIFSNLILHNIILVSKSNSSVIYLYPNSIHQVKNVRMNLHPYQIQKAS